MKSPYYRSSSYEEQQLYDHLIACRKNESPNELLERFRCLFVDGVHYSDSDILSTLHTLANSRLADEEFKFILNRSCRILINYWWFQPSFRWAISELVENLELPPRGTTTQSEVRRLRQLVRQFTRSEEFQSLRRLARVIDEEEEASLGAAQQSRSLRHHIHRYPFLYPHCLSAYNSDSQELETIRHLQKERQHKYECELSRYVTYLVQKAENPSRVGATAIKNPTLLTETQVRNTIKHFDRSGPYRDGAKRFVAYSRQADSYRTFKEGLYQYLVASIESTNSKYGSHHFNQWLKAQLRDILPQSDTQPVSSFLVTRTFHQLLECLVASPKNVSNHLVFVDLVSNVGAMVTVGLLLKLLLIYRNLKSSLEKQFAGLFKHYESMADGAEWLIESLESLQIAFAIHFGSVRFPCVSRL